MRAFLAVELTDDLREGLARVQRDLKTALATGAADRVRMTWARPDTIHLTIKFLGDIDEAHVRPLEQELRDVLRDRRAVDLPLDRLGCFPRPREPRVLWIGPDADWDASGAAADLFTMVRDVDSRCSKLGVPSEQKRWHPHLTLARVRSGERPVGRVLLESGALDREVLAGVLHVRTVALMKSELKPDGPVHTRLWQVDLAT